MPQKTEKAKEAGKQVPRRGRKNVSRACLHCRRRRVKCDARTPSCSRCSERAIECAYSTEEDKRRPAPKSYVDLLRSRIDHLERLLQAHSIDPDGMPNAHAVNDGVSDDLTLRGELSKDESMNFDQDGEARYFGPTSGRLEFKSLHKKRAEYSAATANFNRLCQDLLDQDPVSPELEDHLLDLFFTWEQPFNQAVDERMFRQSRHTDGKWYSPLLLNCVLCIGSRHSDRAEVRTDPQDPNTAGRLFLEKAQVLLYFDLQSPSLTTIQAAMILTTAYCSFGEDAASWLHYGIAMRLALDMGINLDFGVYQQLNAGSPLSMEEVSIRRQIHWTIYCMDKLSAMYTGRTCTYLDFQAAVGLPRVKPPLTSDQSTPDRYLQHSQVLYYQVTLCQIMETILNSLYAPKTGLSREQRGSFWSSCVLKLKNWRYDLPDEMLLERYTPSLPPALFTIHMIYHTAHIQLTKPFLAKPNTENDGASRSEEEPSITKARQMSYLAALGVCQVATKYRSTFGSFRRSAITATHCTLSAALIFLNALSSRWEDVDPSSNQKYIDLCLFVLDELGTAWNPAKRMRQSLHALYEHVQEQRMEGIASEKDAAGSQSQAVAGQTLSELAHAEADLAADVPSDEGQYGLYSVDSYLVSIPVTTSSTLLVYSLNDKMLSSAGNILLTACPG
ncbi:uncharacterized protein NECHADRAFT_39715 [Fusarium vanettenii 77-13-4]|uniref:Zn(2)-C6 fungal-type domain-containing protein n=1 Tax=Fusarium vanettenii (strain ATCC MYA-4622 / CBS 123669 / FGSC 9596 / NRRL 45880 / 77-13-4) TaxID=660122 RepID=C7ZM51_FUSV7|nr:uncharacterized protein NECHADRAFT_39715 [Fusarium vanettenii 77-13-4]EEU34905.1 hypothetical protein NECHADRAFT_39715 [Fusarium vanettenii 77-13-4]